MILQTESVISVSKGGNMGNLNETPSANRLHIGINGNTKTIAMMRVFGYSQKECCRAILGGYRPLSYIGFIIGTVYQYGLLRLMVDIVFKDVEGVPTYKFDFPTMLISLACFITIYEIMMYIYSEKIKKISIKEIMIE
jgi:predicted lysophospholipase L1 biosynthesis ABC-type transport system permease subunit